MSKKFLRYDIIYVETNYSSSSNCKIFKTSNKKQLYKEKKTPGQLFRTACKKKNEESSVTVDIQSLTKKRGWVWEYHAGCKQHAMQLEVQSNTALHPSNSIWSMVEIKTNHYTHTTPVFEAEE